MYTSSCKSQKQRKQKGQTMVREARFLWSGPFDPPQDSLSEPPDEDWDDLDLTPFKRRRRRRAKTRPRPEESEDTVPPRWPIERESA